MSRRFFEVALLVALIGLCSSLSRSAARSEAELLVGYWEESGGDSLSLEPDGTWSRNVPIFGEFGYYLEGGTPTVLVMRIRPGTLYSDTLRAEVLQVDENLLVLSWIDQGRTDQTKQPALEVFVRRSQKPEVGFLRLSRALGSAELSAWLGW
ncbi:MAG: hypothetical protein KC910_04725 [Candidatus Eremiobacteraeota bacterium]|nr:hypothetical protein [Candidatus Eremiobacteraeota bacterium]